MKGLGKILLGFTVMTAALLLYVKEEIEILRVSYRIQEKSSQLSRRSEEYRRLNFEVSQMRSPQNLEKRLGELSLPLTLPKQIQVLRVPESFARPEISPLSFRAPSNNFFDFIGQWVQVAQARTEQ